MPSLRIHFDSADLAQTRVAAEADMLWELALSLPVLQAQRSPARYERWRGWARTQLRADDCRAAAELLGTLVPARGGFPDFITPVRSRPGVSVPAAIDMVADTPTERLSADLSAAFRDRRPAPWVLDLAAGRPTPMRLLTEAMGLYHRVMLESNQRRIDEAVHADRALRARQVLDGGVDGLLSSLPAPIQWTSPILHTEYATDRDLYLGGRGLTLIPSYFCHHRPVAFIDPLLPPVLVYPASGQAHPAGDAAGLARLLGATRAYALSCLRVPCSTSELASRLGTSAGAASKHATALRHAGLISSTRHGPMVLHALTALGETLLGRPAGP